MHPFPVSRAFPGCIELRRIILRVFGSFAILCTISSGRGLITPPTQVSLRNG
jgi:hypothetical protein